MFYPSIARLAGLASAWRKHGISLSISLAVTAAALFIYLATFVGERPTEIFGFVHRMELASLDTRYQLRGRASPDPRIVIVDIDQRSQELLGRWPFPRSHFARLLDLLREDGASVVVFDITFSQPDQAAQPIQTLRARLAELAKQGQAPSPALLAELTRLEQEYNHDRQFAAAIERFPRVVLGNFFLYTPSDLAGLDAAILERYANLLAYFPFPQVRAAPSAQGVESFRNLVQIFEDRFLVPRGGEANIPALTDALRGEYKGTGFFNIFADPDGVVRRTPLVLPFGLSRDPAEWDLYASIDVLAVGLYLGLPRDDVILNFGRAGVESIQFGPHFVIRPDDLGRLSIHYQGPVRSYRYVSIADVVQKNFKPGTFRDKLVLVGASATGIGDLRTTPYGGLDFPGVEIRANVIDTLLNRKFLRRDATQVIADLAIIFLFGIPLGVWLALTPPRRMVLALLLLVPFTAAVYFAFTRGWWLNFVIPAAFTLVPNTGFVALYRVLVEDREKRRVRRTFQQYMSPEVVRRLLENPELVRPRKLEITVLFSDIRGFTSLSEQLDAEEVSNLLYSYLTDMTRVVFRRQGTLDKYIGDALMAFWGAPFEEPGHARKACLASLEMMQRLAEQRREWQAEGKPVLDVGLGLNTGVASVGNMGSELRYGYTAMGDAVNLASRLEGLNKIYGTHILLSQSSYDAAVSPDLIFRELDLIRVIGKLQPVTIFELLAASDGSLNSVEFLELVKIFSGGRAWFKRRDWTKARAVFAQVIERWPLDGPARVFLARCDEYLRDEPAPDWDGVYVFKHK